MEVRSMGRLIGYARVSTGDQDLNMQLDELKAAGCALVFTDKASGAKGDRPGLDQCLSKLKPDDTLLVWRLDRLGRSMQHLVFNIFAALAQFERELIRERTRAGLTAARARGRMGGRKPVSPLDPKVRMAKKMHKDQSLSIDEICSTLRISKATFYRYLALSES
jgi:DNA invertase Pin-like site-specific DNA recombinase